jgi:hypothetical protein
MDNAALVRAYLRLRAKRHELKVAFEAEDKKLKAMQDRLGASMLKALNDGTSESIRTKDGTFYRQTEVTPRGEDWGALYDWIKENDAFDALERRIKKTFVAEYMETHGGAVPPGVSVFREYVVRVRKGD